MEHQHDHDEHRPGGFWGSRYSIGLLVLGGIAAYFLLTEHLAHVIGVLPLSLAACLSADASFHASRTWASRLASRPWQRS